MKSCLGILDVSDGNYESPSPMIISAFFSTRLECVCRLGSEFRRGAGVLDMVFESPFQLFTCGYDTFIRLWDLRLSPRYANTSLLLSSTSTFQLVLMRISSLLNE